MNLRRLSPVCREYSWADSDACDNCQALMKEEPSGAYVGFESIEALFVPRPSDDWSESDGPVLWWKFPVVEPPYAGTPLDDDFPDYVTHFTAIPEVQEPSLGPAEGGAS